MTKKIASGLTNIVKEEDRLQSEARLNKKEDRDVKIFIEEIKKNMDGVPDIDDLPWE